MKSYLDKPSNHPSLPMNRRAAPSLQEVLHAAFDNGHEGEFSKNYPDDAAPGFWIEQEDYWRLLRVLKQEGRLNGTA
jgi:hypothetical protein